MELKAGSLNIGTVVGIIVIAVAIIGSVFFGWEWDAFPDQPVPLVIGVVAAIVAVIVVIRVVRD